VETKAQHEVKELFGQVDLADPTGSLPLSDKEENEVVIGKIDDDYLKKLYLVGMIHRREQERNEVEVKYERDPVARKTLEDSVVRSGYQANVLMNTFWFGVRAVYDLWQEQGIGVRGDWNLVREIEKDDSFGKFLLKRISGQ
jgi:hypothetical protein